MARTASGKGCDRIVLLPERPVGRIPSGVQLSNQRRVARIQYRLCWRKASASLAHHTLGEFLGGGLRCCRSSGPSVHVPDWPSAVAH